MSKYTSHNSARLRVDRSEDMFSCIFRENYAKLVLYALQFVRQQDAAEDIVQNCFISYWKKSRDLDVQVAMPYLYGAIKKASIKYLRDRKHLLEFDESIKAGFVSDNLLAIEAETLDLVYKSFSALPPKCRTIFKLLFIEGKSHAEIAEKLNISESTIRTQKAKGVHMIRERVLRMIGLFIVAFLSM